jgi:four helix bundle protein
MARGSLFEWETHMDIAMRLQFVTEKRAQTLLPIAQDVNKMLNGLIAALEASAAGSKP